MHKCSTIVSLPSVGIDESNQQTWQVLQQVNKAWGRSWTGTPGDNSEHNTEVYEPKGIAQLTAYNCQYVSYFNTEWSNKSIIKLSSLRQGSYVCMCFNTFWWSGSLICATHTNWGRYRLALYPGSSMIFYYFFAREKTGHEPSYRLLLKPLPTSWGINFE